MKRKPLLSQKMRCFLIRLVNLWLSRCEDAKSFNRAIYLLNFFKKGRSVESVLLKYQQVLPWLERIMKLHPNCRSKLFPNFLLNASILRPKGYRHYMRKYGVQPPYSVLISPTMRCNLRCKGCYAANYSRKDDLPFSLVNRIINEGKEIGVTLFTILGGEPFFWEHLFEMFALYPDAYFQVYTNGTLIGEKEAKRLQELGNVVVMFSLDGFEKSTNARRGKEVFNKVMKAADLLRKYRIGFGYSCCVTRQNVKEVLSDEFIDLMIEKGALLGWYFLYMPVGGEATLEFMPTPEDRIYMNERHDCIRSSRPLPVFDFWNDAPHVNGCIAAGRGYCHINHRGDVEPCIFLHLATDNVKNTSLTEALNSPFFRGIRAKQPFNENLFLPCQMIDNPDVSKELYDTFHPYSTHPGAEEIITKLHPCLMKYSKRVTKLYEPVWENWKRANHD